METTGTKFNKWAVARAIARMPFYETHYRVRTIVKALEADEIPESIISEALENIKDFQELQNDPMAWMKKHEWDK